jgi:hypothetical protein
VDKVIDLGDDVIEEVLKMMILSGDNVEICWCNGILQKKKEINEKKKINIH